MNTHIVFTLLHIKHRNIYNNFYFLIIFTDTLI